MLGRDHVKSQSEDLAEENIRLKEEMAKLKEEIAILRATDSSSTATGFTITAGSTESAATPVTGQNLLSPHLSQLTQLETQYKNLLQHHSVNVIKRAIASQSVHRVVKRSNLHKQKTTLVDRIEALERILNNKIIEEKQKTAQRIQALDAELNQQLERIKQEIIASIEDDAKLNQLTEERSLCRSKCDVKKQILNSELNQTIDGLKRTHEETLSKIRHELGLIQSEQQSKKSSLTKRSERIAAWTDVISQQYELLSNNLKLQKKQREVLVSDITDFAAESNKKSLIIDERLNTIIRRLDKRYPPQVQLTKAQQLALAAQQGHLSKVQRLLQEGGVRIDEKDDDGMTALLWAAQMGRLPVVQWLLREGGARIDEKDKYGNTALLWAAQMGRLPVVQWLLREGGARIDEKAYCDNTALLLAALKGHLPVVQWLLQEDGARIDEKNDAGNTALLLAALNGHLPVVQWLLREGHAHIDEKNINGTTALLYAALNGHLSVVQWLLQEGGARIDDKDKYGYTALLWAAYHGRLSMVQWLLREGGVRIDEMNNLGQTALSIARSQRHTDVADYLASFQASLTTNRNPQPNSPSASPAFFKPSASNAISAVTPVVSASPKLIPKLPSPQGMTFK